MQFGTIMYNGFRIVCPHWAWSTACNLTIMHQFSVCSVSCQLSTTFCTLEHNLGAEGCRSLILAAKDSWTTGCPVQPFWSYNYIHCLSACHFCGPGDWPVIDQAYQLLTARTIAYANSEKSISNFASQPPSNLGLARIAEQGVPRLYSRFWEESWYNSRVTMRSDKTRACLLFAGLRSYDFLVKKSFPLVKTSANVYQSLQEAFY